MALKSRPYDHPEERAKREDAARRRREERERIQALIALEDSGEARGFRYALECRSLFVGPHTRPGPHLSEDSCTHLEPVIYEGTRETAQARARRHNDLNSRGGAVHHSAFIVPDGQIGRRLREIKAGR